MYELMIIGSGPAGVSAALNAKARGIDFIWFGNRRLSAKIEKAERIMNYPGLSAVTGEQMRQVFSDQLHAAGISITEKRIDSIYDMGDYYIACSNDETFEGKSLILATGVTNTKEIPGESKFLGKGVSYCATCDGELYRGKRIAGVCTDRELEEELEYLADLASQVLVYTTYRDCGVARKNLTCFHGYPDRIFGKEKASSISCGGETRDVDGIFILRDSVSPASLLQGLETQDGHILVDRQQRTNLQGCFAAGDCTGRPYQYAKAVGEGNVALHSVISYLRTKAEKERGQDLAEKN